MPLDATVTLDSTTWAAIALLLTVLGAAYTWATYRRRGVAAGLRGLAWTLIPVAALLTGTLKLAANIAGDVVDWATRLVFSPVVWVGVILAGVAAVLWVVSGVLRARGIGVRRPAPATGARRSRQMPAASRREAAAEPATRQPVTKQPVTKQPSSRARKRGNPDDIEDLDDIEAILKRHGI